VPKFRVLSDPNEQMAAYRADSRLKQVLVPPVLQGQTRNVEPDGRPSDKRNYASYLHLWAELLERWRARPRVPRKGLGPITGWIVEKLRLLRAGVGEALADEARCHFLRHLVMFWSLGVVFAWFAAQQLHNPDAWVHFVPSFIQGLAILPESMLIRLHGTLLLVASAGLLAGVGVRIAAGLGAFILVQIIAALAISGGEANLIARDVGLLGLALGLVFDPTPTSGHVLPSFLTSLPFSRRQTYAPPSIPAYSGNGAIFSHATRAHLARTTVMSETGPIGNGDDYTVRTSRAASDAELIARHDQPPMAVGGVYSFREDSVPLKDSDSLDLHLLRLTATMTRLTWLIAGLVAVNVIAVIVGALVAIVVFSRGG